MALFVQLKKRYEGFTLDVEFQAEQGVMALLGASGCGKSLTLKCIAGVVKPDAGRIVADGVTFFDSAKGINLTPQQRHVGLLFQNYALFPNMTVEQNILTGLAREKNRTDKRAAAARLVETFCLSGLERHLPHQLSGGQQQRVALARILAGEPSVLMLDEPFAALDSYLKWKLEQELMDILAAFPGTALYVSHNRDEVYRLCRDVCVMDRGKTQPVTRVKDLFRAPATVSAALLSGCKNICPAQYLGPHRLLAVDWGVELVCARPVSETVRFLGVRAHSVKLEGGENRIHCRTLRRVEDVFSHVLVFQPLAAPEESEYAQIRMEFPKNGLDPGSIGGETALYIAPHDIMPLE